MLTDEYGIVHDYDRQHAARMQKQQEIWANAHETHESL